MLLKHLALSALLTSILVITKYLFGFIPGVEITTFLCILYAVLLSWKMWLQIIISFILIIGLIYGFGLWWGIYWFIFLTEALLSWLLKKLLLKSPFIFASWCGFWGFSIIFWYFGYDLILFGYSKAIISFSTAIMTNLLGAISNFVVALILIQPCHNLFNNKLKSYHDNYWLK